MLFRSGLKRGIHRTGAGCESGIYVSHFWWTEAVVAITETGTSGPVAMDVVDRLAHPSDADVAAVDAPECRAPGLPTE